MEFFKKALGLVMGYKTHILVVIAVVISVVNGGQGLNGFSLENIDADTLQNSLMLFMISTAKAAFDRFANK